MESFSKFNIVNEELLSVAKKVSEERFAGNAPMQITEELAKKLLEELNHLFQKCDYSDQKGKN